MSPISPQRGICTLSSVCIFSILFSILFLRCWQGEFVQQSLVGDHFLYSCDLDVWFRGAIVRYSTACNFTKYTRKNMCKKSSLVCTTVKRSSFAIQTHVAQDYKNRGWTVQSDTNDLTLSTLAPVWVSSILISIHLLRRWQGDCVQQSRAFLVGDHLLW